MFLVVALALAAPPPPVPVTITQGWPCQRLNWAWRIVWTTCSINVFTPQTAAESPSTIPNGVRFIGAPSGATSMGYVFAPNTQGTTYALSSGTFSQTDGAALPALMCQNAPNTGSGVSATVRNRCRRALDSYGGLLKQCQMGTGSGPIRGPNNLAQPDYAPDSNLQPHVTNIVALQQNARYCTLPMGYNGYAPNVNPTGLPAYGPAYVCPGLLGWFNVVLNACGFTNNPNLNWPNLGTPLAASQNFPNVFPAQAPLGNGATTSGGGFSTLPSITLPAAGGVGVANGPVVALGPNYVFCGAPVAPGSTAFNSNQQVGGVSVFRTSRCRKALDQFGRTAGRCNASPMGGAAAPNQAGGYSDPLRLWAVGHQAPAVIPQTGMSPLAPDGADAWAPNCN